MTCLFHPYDSTQFVLLKYFVLCSMLPDVRFVSTVFMLLMFAWNFPTFALFIDNFIYLFGCAAYSLLHRLFSSCGKQGLLSSCCVWASSGSGFLCCVQSTSSRAWGLQQSQFPGSELWHMGLVVLQHVGSSQTRDQTRVSYTGRQILYHWAIKPQSLLLIFLGHSAFKLCPETGMQMALLSNRNWEASCLTYLHFSS